MRATLRTAVFVHVFLAMAFLAVAHRALLPATLHDAGGPRLRRTIGRTVCRAAGVRVIRRGAMPASLEPLVVCNHVSWIDAFVLAAVLGARFVVAESWHRVPVLRTILAAGGNLFIDRRRLRDARTVGNQIAALTGAGDRVVVFPEAGTSRGEAVQRFHAALLHPAAQHGTSVSWAVLRYETPQGWPPAGAVMGWVDWTPLVLKVFRGFFVPSVRAEVLLGSSVVAAGDRRALAAELRRRISVTFVPLSQLPPSDVARLHCPKSRWHR